MLNTTAHTSSLSTHNALYFAVLENAEVGVVVVNPEGSAVYMNSSARSALESPLGTLPRWVAAHVAPVLANLRQATHAIERWAHDDLILRVRARPLDATSGLVVLELSVTQGGGTGSRMADQLSRGLRLTFTDAKLLSLLWQGMSNDDIAEALTIRVGTVKSRLFRLYQKLGVKRRSAAVLLAADILAA